MAKPAGGACEAIIGGHYDSVPAGPGANDNGSGAATVLEVARTLAAQGRTDGVCVTLFGAEELGLLGSFHYVSALTDAEKSQIKGMLNFDMLAVGDAWPLVGSPPLVQIAGGVAQQQGLNTPRTRTCPGTLAATMPASSTPASPRSCSTASAMSITTPRRTSFSTCRKAGWRRPGRWAWAPSRSC